MPKTENPAAVCIGEPGKNGIEDNTDFNAARQDNQGFFDFNNAPRQNNEPPEQSREWFQEQAKQKTESERQQYGDAGQEETGFVLSDWESTTAYSGEPETRQYFIHGVFPRGQVSLLGGAGGVCKSMMSLQAARYGALASRGLNVVMFGGVMESTGPTVYISAEDDQIEIHSRLNNMGGPVPGLIAVPLPSAGGAPIFFKSDAAGPVATDQWWNFYQQSKEIKNLSVMILDPLQVFCSLDLNMPENAQFVCSHASRLASETGAAFIVSHHFRKGAVNGVEDAREAIRGTAGLVDGVRAVYALWMPKTGPGKESPQAICKSLQIPYVPGIVVHGAVVKANGRANNHVSTFIRDQKTGLLIDKSDAVRGFFGGNLPDILIDSISAAALNGKLYTRTGLNGLFTRRHELPEPFHMVSKHRLHEMADDLLQSKKVVLAMAEGSKILKWLDVPSGPFAKGEGVFEHGFYQK